MNLTHRIINNSSKFLINQVIKYSTYSKQDRGNESSYTKYLNEMDASMQQKVAATAAHILIEGNVADMGMGSGATSFALASLYPNLNIAGVDNNPVMVNRAKKTYVRKNLRFIESDIAKRCLPLNSQEAIINSSVLHHVTSFNNYDHNAAVRAIATQNSQLAEDGLLIVRDFLDPGKVPVWLDLPKGPVVEYFNRFTKEFRSLSDSPGCEYKELQAPKGFRRFELQKKHATEFVLRKDYVDSWDLEIQEEYTYATREKFEQTFESLGLRILASTPIYNPWIIANRFQDQFVLRDTKGKEVDFPATNYVIVGQKVPEGEGVRIEEQKKVKPLDYLSMKHYQIKDTGKVFDLVRRPGVTLDVLPYYQKKGQFYLLARRGYPRPIVGFNQEGTVSLDGSKPSVYLTEPLNMIQTDKPSAQNAEELLQEFGNVNIHKMHKGLRFFPSPGGIQEEVKSIYVEIDPTSVKTPLKDQSGFSTSGILRPIDAHQLLRAAQVGALPDIRLEMNTYHLFSKYQIDPGSWIGEKITLKDGPLPKFTSLQEVVNRQPRRCFQHTSERSYFLELKCSEFIEKDSKNNTVSKKALEFVIPSQLSCNTVTVAILRKHQGEVFIGVEDDNLPAAQCFNGQSNLPVTPAWRLPKEISGIKQYQKWISNQLFEDYGIRHRPFWELGGRYHPSPGVTPEIVTPLAVEVMEESSTQRNIDWVPLTEAIKYQNLILDGHLRIAVLRVAHGLGLLKKL